MKRPDFEDLPGVRHRDRAGVVWHQAPAPFPLHSHFSWSEGWVRSRFVQRCPCGAIKINRDWFLDHRPRIGFAYYTTK